MDAGLAHHTDVCDVTPVDAQVGAADGDGDSSQQGAKARDDLGGGGGGGGRRDLGWIETD